MHKSFLLLFLASLLFPFCNSDTCNNLGARYSDIRTEFDKIKTGIAGHRETSLDRRLKKLHREVLELESDFDGCGIDNSDKLIDNLGRLINSFTISQLRSEIEQSLPLDGKGDDPYVPNEWDIRSAIRKIEKSLQQLHPNIQIDEAGNVEMQGHRFYIESVRTEVVDSGISIACIRNEQCISDNLSATGIPMDHMKAQRIVEYLTDYKAVIVCKHTKANCSEILKKYKN